MVRLGPLGSAGVEVWNEETSVVEINLGQMVLEVERVAGGRCQVGLSPNPGGRVHYPEEILALVKEMYK